MSNKNEAVIRSRAVQSRRRRDGLIRFAADNTSQNGEDGIIERIFELLPPPPPECSCRWLVDVGAWDGVHLSNTYSLLFEKCVLREQRHESEEGAQRSWRGVLIEADQERYAKLSALHASTNNICLNVAVSVDGGPNSLCNILSQQTQLPKTFDFLCIDIDGGDYWILSDALKAAYRPKLICIEFNPTMPDDLIYIPAQDDSVRHGASLSALVELAAGYNYVLVETTLFNAFLVQKHLYEKHLKAEVPDTSIEALHEHSMRTTLYQLYDGTLKLWGCKKLLWHRMAIDEKKMQMLAPTERKFPFAPGTKDDTLISDTFHTVDVSPYCNLCGDTDHEAKQKCAKHLFRQLQDDGFCLIRGTGMDRILCQKALDATNAFLQEANENVRRSCLAKDRARRGYSPMNVENFASLIGGQGPNDLVRKFRVGPKCDGVNKQICRSSLMQPNVWPTEWEAAAFFQCAVEDYYEAACNIAKAVVRAICDGLLHVHPELQSSIEPLASVEDPSVYATSILTLLGYRPGTRHKGKNKGPLVAAHTDVGVITMLLFDRSNSCATLQRSDGKGGWVDVKLPDSVPNDPIFVVNVADCFSELSTGKVPSTLHRVIAQRGSNVPRNCCALFVGLNPDAQLTIGGEQISYEEWRKRRIARAQNALKQNVV
jgi:isopenicillin N synthase-like dioxygenase